MKKVRKMLAGIITSIALLGALVLPTTGFAQTSTNNVENLGIYYGYPSLVNGANGDITKATATFKPYQVIVFGDGIEHVNHDDHSNTQKIIDNLKPNGNKIFGYVPIGTSCCSGLSTSQIKTNIDEWKNMNVYGVFLDEFGFDYNVTRAKQNDIVSYAHSKGLKVIANAWIPVDAMGNKDENGAIVPTQLGSGDYFLMESFLSDSGNLQPSKQWVDKADSALSLSKSTGVQVAVLSTTQNPSSNDTNDVKFKMASYATAMYGFSAFQWTDGNYSASNNIINQYTLPQNYGTYFTEDSVTHDSGYANMTRKTDTGQFVITQNGSTGSASFTGNGSAPTPTPDPTPTPTPTPDPTTADLQKQIDSLKAENTALKANVTTLTTENTSLKNTNNSLSSKIANLKTIFDDFVTKNNDALK